MKDWDAYIGNRGSVEIRNRGYFEKINSVSFVKWSDNDYVIADNYRFPKSEFDRPEVQKFLKRVRAARSAEKEVK